ncbi:exosortase [Sandarakinorhabdus cyanobacteriorum]|uniref:Exosortase n=1 Tax=Sandarakinorhabdus cyanobacteriorum TaxID=1981098 RepID=A0A255YHL1_9SPHN|nr:exosortase V [Sandarakinorhabdus cyanobacteriorum]OYQ28757.1 exosortase [Sandarakinorhabdus cyanobacteriorum]
MTSEAASQAVGAATGRTAAGPDVRAFVRNQWPLAAGLAVLALPTIVSLARGPWQEESGVHGVIVLVTGIWLVMRRWNDIVRLQRPGNPVLTALLLAVAMVVYIGGRAFEFISIEAAALLLAMVAVIQQYWGMAVLRMLWFPIFYLGFVIPLPGWFLDQITLPLKEFVSQIVTDSLAAMDYPIARLGVTIYVGAYQLLVEDACAGLNSLVSLSAIGLFYVYLLRGSNPAYSMLLLAMVIPIAILANGVRVAALVLITYYLGNAWAQGYLHNFAGMVTFVSALLLIFALDWVLTPLRNRLESKGVVA